MDVVQKIAINREFLQRYARAVSSALCPEKITNGGEVLSLTPIEQVNYLLLLKLERRWKRDFRRVRSPYFDYTNQKVQQALQHFMNILSEHIRIEKAHLQPLLEEAVQDTLLLILFPRAFYEREWRAVELLEKDYWMSIKKYVKHNAAFLEKLSSQIETTPFAAMPSREAISVLYRVYETEKNSLEDIDAHLEAFQGVVEVKKVNFFEISHLSSTTQKKETLSLLSNIHPHLQKTFIEELFDGQKNRFEQAIKEAEECATFDQSMSHLVKHHGVKTHNANAKELFKLVYRRFKRTEI